MRKNVLSTHFSNVVYFSNRYKIFLGSLINKRVYKNLCSGKWKFSFISYKIKFTILKRNGYAVSYLKTIAEYRIIAFIYIMIKHYIALHSSQTYPHNVENYTIQCG